MSEVRILCACLSNSDRSPFMEKILELLLQNQGRTNIRIESAGVLESAKQGGSAPALSVALAPTYGVDLTTHRKRHLDDVDIKHIDLFIAADKQTQSKLVERGISTEIICLDLEGQANAWMSKNPRKVEMMIASIYHALIIEVLQYKFRL